MRNVPLVQKYFISVSLSLCFIIGAWDMAEAQTGSKAITSIKCNKFTFDASGSYDPDNENISFYWYFGDGKTSREPVVSHTYEKSGVYEVQLTITDTSGLECSTASKTQSVFVNIPPTAVLSVPNNICVGQDLSFDASRSYDDTQSQLIYAWDFGDGDTAGDEVRVSKNYLKGGDYKIVLTVDDQNTNVCNVDTEEAIVHVNQAPDADAGDEEILVCVNDNADMQVTFDAGNTVDVNNDPLTYEWEFGDGEQATGIRVIHQYKEIGNYDAKLVVKDNSQLSCATGVDFIRVRLNKAPKADAGDDIVACVGAEVSFDGSQTYVYKKGTVESKWSFGDGNSARGLKASHVYTSPGTYQAQLEVENKLNSMCPPSRDSRNVTINSAPRVALKPVSTACLGNEVHFDATDSSDDDGDNLEYYWTFGDGNSLTAGPKVSHNYSQGGTYRVNVIVDDSKDSACSTAGASLLVEVNTPPNADSGANLACCVDKETYFSAKTSSDPDGDELSYTWEFGDGSKTDGENVSHVYTKSGTYKVTLTVDDNSGTACSRSTSEFDAIVNTTPVPVMNIR